uniref:Uncharacterized protein n=1 Tax=Acanthochromis polyacanthus TaxID=80966 RepID=A0A3Q1G6H4_9TELE
DFLELLLVSASQSVTEAWTATLYTVCFYTERRRGQRSTSGVERGRGKEGALESKTCGSGEKIPSQTAFS